MTDETSLPLTMLEPRGAMTPIHYNHPVRKAWEAYQQTESYENSLKWASYEEHRDGSMWVVFLHGWQAYETDCLVPVERDQEGGKTLKEWREGDAPTSAQVQDDMRRTIDLLRQDIIAYRGALGYPVTGGNLGLLSDGSEPENGIARVMTEDNRILYSKAKELHEQCEVLRRAARLVYRRHAMVSGSAEMAECDAVCKEAGLEVWTWPAAVPLTKAYVTPLDAVFDALAEASNALDDMEGAKKLCIFTTLDKAIDAATRICQAWREEEKERADKS